MPQEITTAYDAQVNLTVAQEALKRGKAEKLDRKSIKRLEKHVRDAKAIVKQIDDALKASKK